MKPNQTHSNSSCTSSVNHFPRECRHEWHHKDKPSILSTRGSPADGTGVRKRQASHSQGSNSELLIIQATDNHYSAIIFCALTYPSSWHACESLYFYKSFKHFANGELKCTVFYAGYKQTCIKHEACKCANVPWYLWPCLGTLFSTCQEPHSMKVARASHLVLQRSLWPSLEGRFSWIRLRITTGKRTQERSGTTACPAFSSSTS